MTIHTLQSFDVRQVIRSQLNKFLDGKLRYRKVLVSTETQIKRVAKVYKGTGNHPSIKST